jgi:hypothetical protein
MELMKTTCQKKILKASFLFFLVFISSKAGICDTSQAWFKNTAIFALSPEWSFKLAQETRNLDITFSNPYLKGIGGGLVYHFPKNFYVSANYKRVHVELQDVVYNENRFNLEAGWKTALAENLNFDIYFRTEIRDFDKDFPEDHLRFRFRVRLKTVARIGKLEIKPYIANETFGKSKIYTVQKNRLYIGMLIPLGDHMEFNLSYMWLAARDVESVHILYSGFQLKF